MAAGLGALLALERRDARGDLMACGLLSVAIGFSTLGLPFLVAAGVAIATGPRGSRSGRLFTLVVPAGLFVVWWLGWGREAESSLTPRTSSRRHLIWLDGLASAISSVLGLATPRDESQVTALDWGRPLLVALLALGAWRLWRLQRIDPALLVVVAPCGVVLAARGDR